MASCTLAPVNSSALADHLEFILGEHLSFAAAGVCNVQLREKFLSKAEPHIFFFRASLIAQLVKRLPAMQESLVRFLGRKDLLEKG